jgi:hypothetical protein
MSRLSLRRPGQEQLVLHDAVLDAGGVGEPGQLERAVEVSASRLLGVDVLAGVDRLRERLLAGRGDLGVEVDLDGRVGRVLAAADEDRFRPQHGSVAEV